MHRTMLLPYFLALLIAVIPHESVRAQDLNNMISHGNLSAYAIDFSDRATWEQQRQSGTNEDLSVLRNNVLFINDQGKLLASLEWLKDVVKNQGESRYVYPFMYAIQIHRTGYMSGNMQAKITARAMMNYSKLLLATNAVRCDDNGVGNDRFHSLSNTLVEVDERTSDIPPHAKKLASDIALFMEEKHKDREKDKGICMTGIDFTARALASKNTKTVETIAKEGNVYDYVVGSKVTTIIPDKNIEVFYITDDEWHTKRQKIRTSMAKYFNED